MKSLARSASLTAFLLIISKILGFLREILLADRFGTTYIADAYTIASSLPTVLFALFASGFTNSFIPAYVRTPHDKRSQFFSNTCSILFSISLLVTGLCVIFRQNVVDLLAPGFSYESAELTTQFISVIAFYLPFFVVFNILTAYLQTQEDFIPGSFCDFILVNLVLIVSIGISSPQAPMGLAYGYVISMALALSVLWLYARRRYGLRWQPVFDLRDRDFRRLCSLAIPLGLSLMADQLNGMVDRMFASGLGEGVTSALSYANRVQSILLTLTTTIFIQVCYPRMNRHFEAGEREDGSRYVRKALLIACYTSIPLVAMFALYAPPIVRVIFQRGAFSEQSTAVTAACLSLYAVGIPFFAFRSILTNTLAANTRQRLILRNTLVTVASNILLNLLLVRYWGYCGLALATSLSGALAAGLMYRDVRKLELSVFTRREAADVAKYLLGTACAVAVSLPVCRLLRAPLGENGASLAAIAAAGAAYILLTGLLKPELLMWLHAHLPAKLQIMRGYYPVSEGEHHDESISDRRRRVHRQPPDGASGGKGL